MWLFFFYLLWQLVKDFLQPCELQFKLAECEISRQQTIINGYEQLIGLVCTNMKEYVRADT